MSFIKSEIWQVLTTSLFPFMLYQEAQLQKLKFPKRVCPTTHIIFLHFILSLVTVYKICYLIVN